jgi:UDP-N-acetylmuramoyl-tripeptide--D-alanyl-D-alanine ligase
VHLEGLGSLEAIAHAKAELLEGLPAEGTVVANRDDPWVRWIAARHPGPVVWFGLEAEDADYRAVGLEPRADGAVGTRFRLLTPSGEASVELPLHGRYNVANLLAAAACALPLGVRLEHVPEAAAALRPMAGRGMVHRLPKEITVVDDSYNSSPVALAQALESAAALPARRHWAVLGDMLELGPEAPHFHREAGELAARLGFAPVAGVGAACRELVAGAQAGGAQAHWMADADEAAKWASAELAAGDLVLVKGSRGVGLEAVVAALLEGRG